MKTEDPCLELGGEQVGKNVYRFEVSIDSGIFDVMEFVLTIDFQLPWKVGSLEGREHKFWGLFYTTARSKRKIMTLLTVLKFILAGVHVISPGIHMGISRMRGRLRISGLMVHNEYKMTLPLMTLGLDLGEAYEPPLPLQPSTWNIWRGRCAHNCWLEAQSSNIIYDLESSLEGLYVFSLQSVSHYPWGSWECTKLSQDPQPSSPIAGEVIWLFDEFHLSATPTSWQDTLPFEIQKLPHEDLSFSFHVNTFTRFKNRKGIRRILPKRVFKERMEEILLVSSPARNNNETAGKGDKRVLTLSNFFVVSRLFFRRVKLFLGRRGCFGTPRDIIFSILYISSDLVHSGPALCHSSIWHHLLLEERGPLGGIFATDCYR